MLDLNTLLTKKFSDQICQPIESWQNVNVRLVVDLADFNGVDDGGATAVKAQVGHNVAFDVNGISNNGAAGVDEQGVCPDPVRSMDVLQTQSNIQSVFLGVR